MENFKLKEEFLESVSKNGLDDRIIVLSSNIFKDSYQNPIHHIARASGGFGCSPDARGSAIFIDYLQDNTSGRTERGSIAYIIKKDKEEEFLAEFNKYNEAFKSSETTKEIVTKNLVERYEEANLLAREELGKFLRHETGHSYPHDIVNDYIYDEMFNHLTYLIIAEGDNNIGTEKMKSLCRNVYKLYSKFFDN